MCQLLNALILRKIRLKSKDIKTNSKVEKNLKNLPFKCNIEILSSYYYENETYYKLPIYGWIKPCICCKTFTGQSLHFNFKNQNIKIYLCTECKKNNMFKDYNESKFFRYRYKLFKRKNKCK